MRHGFLWQLGILFETDTPLIPSYFALIWYNQPKPRHLVSEVAEIPEFVPEISFRDRLTPPHKSLSDRPDCPKYRNSNLALTL